MNVDGSSIFSRTHRLGLIVGSQAALSRYSLNEPCELVPNDSAINIIRPRVIVWLIATDGVA